MYFEEQLYIYTINSTLCLLVSPADDLYKVFGHRSGLTKGQTKCGSKLFDTLIIFLKEFLKQSSWKKINKHPPKKVKLPSMWIVHWGACLYLYLFKKWIWFFGMFMETWIFRVSCKVSEAQSGSLPKKIFFSFFLWGFIFILSPHKHKLWWQSTTTKSYFSIHLMAIVCVMANLLLNWQKM